jgi:hypothetical protein
VARARELFLQATEERDQGDLPGALEKFRVAHALAGNPVTAMELGRTYAVLGKLVEARDVLLSVAHIPVQPDESTRATQSRLQAAELAEELRSRIPTLAVKMAVPTEVLSIVVDGTPVPSAVVGAPRAVNPGRHDVVTAVAGRDRIERKIDVKEGETREIELAPIARVPEVPEPKHAPPSPAAPAPPAEVPAEGTSGGGRFGALTYIGFGVGAAGFLVGSAMGIVALSKANAAQNECTVQNIQTCAAQVADDLQSARTFGYASTVALAVAGIGVAAGIVDLVLSTPKAQAAGSSARTLRPWVGLGAAGLRGSF